MQQAKPEPMWMIISIVERGHGRQLIELYSARQMVTHLLCLGHGTASSEMLSLLGLGESEKDVLLGIGQRSVVRQTMGSMNNANLACAIRGRGIVFSVPLTGVNALLAAATTLARTEQAHSGQTPETKQEEPMMQQNGTRHSLILISVNQGYTDAVMDTARRVGATGGTIVRARWAGAQPLEQFYGITLQLEKEVIAILAQEGSRRAIMEAVNLNHGLKTDAQAVICSVAVEEALKLN